MTIPSPSHKFQVLLVDDEKANLNLLKRTFRTEYELLTAEDGLAGLEIIKRNPVDLIITDQRMPRMTGIEMLIRSRELVPDAVRIILTAYTDVRDIIDSINQGHVYRYLVKPWSPDELKVTVAQALEYYNLTMENRRLVVDLQSSLNKLQEAQSKLLLRERLSTIGRLASSIIHDLKLPMANIRASAALLARNQLTRENREEFASMITREVDRLIEMTREILEFARGETKLDLDLFTMDELLNEVCDLVEADFKLSKVSLKRRWNPIGQYRGDAGRLRRVFLNLALNSRDAMVKGGELGIYGERNAHEIVIRIDDQGRGIPDEIMSTLFEPFVTLGKHGGTGLGLSIAQKIVEAHKGTINAANKTTGGAQFTIVLPLTTDVGGD